MESWVPLFNIFLNSPSPESEASLWLQQSFNASASTTTTTTITTASFLSLLAKPIEATVLNSSSSDSSPPYKKRVVMWIQTLPNVVQSRILSFLAIERQRFCSRDLCGLAKNILRERPELDFWVKRGAHNLLETVSESNNYEWISCLSLDSVEESVEDEFDALPIWLKEEVVSSNDLVLPWLPLSVDELNSKTFLGVTCGDESELVEEVGEGGEENCEEVDVGIKAFSPVTATLEPEVQKMATCLKDRILSFESVSKTVGLVNEIRELCFGGRGDSFAVLGLIEPWKADDETASVLISNISNGSEDELAWPSQVLCSIVLPKFLVLEEPASRVLVTATIEYCKVHQRAAEYAFLVPLILRREGINKPICDVITRIVRECLHPAHVSAFCQKLLCGEKDARKFICLPCHQCLLSNELVWTESLFNLFQNILNHNVHLTQDSIDHLVHQVQKLSERFSKSLKFCNFLLCLITKCSPFLKSHKLSLIEAVEYTDTLVTKSVLSKLSTL